MNISRRKMLILLPAAAVAWESVLAGTPEESPNYKMSDHWWSMLIDISKCIGCGNCVRACQTENDVPDGYFRTWVERYNVSDENMTEPEVISPDGGKEGFPVASEDGRKYFFVPKLCNHCADSPCTQVCPVGATFISPDGVGLVDQKELAVRPHLLPVDVVVRGRADVNADAVLVEVRDLVPRQGGVAAADGLGQPLTLDLAGGRQAYRPGGDVEVVRAPVGHRAARVFVPVAEIRVAALRHVVGFWRLPQPEVPVEAGGDRGRLERALAQAGGQPNLGPPQVPDPAVADQLARQPEALGAALLRAGLQHDAVPAHGIDHVPALLDRERQGLLGIDVLAGLRGGDVDKRVPVVGGRVDDGVDVRPLEHPSEIRVLRGRLAADGEFPRGLGRVARVDVADGDDLAVVGCIRAVALSHSTAAYEGDARAVVRRKGLRRLGGAEHLALDEPGGHAGQRGDGGDPPEERPARDLEVLGRGTGRRPAGGGGVVHGSGGGRALPGAVVSLGCRSTARPFASRAGAAPARRHAGLIAAKSGRTKLQTRAAGNFLVD